MLNENIIIDKKKQKLTIEEELEILKKENRKLRERVSLFANILSNTNSIVFICNFITEKLLWCTDIDYFKELLGVNYLQYININNLSFLEKIHPTDKSLFHHKSLYFRENKGNRFSMIFRIKIIDNSYRWFYLKVSLCKSTKNSEDMKCLCFMTEFDENLHSTSQINELNKTYLRERYKGTISKLTEQELNIIKYISRGKTRKEIQTIMGFKTLSQLNNYIKSIFLKVGVDNAPSLANLFSDFGLY